MRSNRHSWSSFNRQRGVALVITVILVTVITFMAIAFLSLSRREKGAVTTVSDQSVARLATEGALDRAKAELLSHILAVTNLNNFDLCVSTNFINRNGFIANLPANADHRTNVNYEYRVGGGGLNGTDALENLANLMYSPRPPVYVFNPVTRNTEFRFYHDMNRNGRYDPSGWWGVTNELKQPVLTSSNTVATNFFIGDPEWIGQLARPDLPHSATNQFVSRSIYLVVPAGKTLDINYIHNQAYNPNKTALDPFGRDFYRNEGVGSWEINLAAFLYDLNTNDVYGWGWQYDYDPANPIPPQTAGRGFEDAGEIYRYRLNGPAGMNYDLRHVRTLYNPAGILAFGADKIDGYSAGPILTDWRGYGDREPDQLDAAGGITDDLSYSWPGADNTNHFFTTQDLFDLAKLSGNFATRLRNTGTNISSYDRYTYYRMLAQLGTDSVPEDKLNLNYANIGAFKNTNFVAWDSPQVVAAFGRPGSEVFFINAAERLLRSYSGNQFGATNIPVMINGTNVYTPSMHRQLQLAANIWDATTNRTFLGTTNQFPTVFRPQFERRPPNNDIYITNFVEVTGTNQLVGAILRDLSNTNIAANVLPNDLLFGVPLVVGARKGLPNFNEFAMETVVQITRKVTLRKASNPPGGAEDIVATNQMFTIGISNVSGVEFWNSYAASYPRPVTIYVANYLTMKLTNDFGVVTGTPFFMNANPLDLPSSARVVSNSWPGSKLPPNKSPNGPSYVVPLRSNVVFLADAAYQQGAPGQFVPLTQALPNADGDFYFPRWGLTVTNRVHAMIVDNVPPYRILDYIQLNDLTGYLDIAHLIGQDPNGLFFDGLWATNTLQPAGIYLGDQPGVLQQIFVSMGNAPDPAIEWSDYGIGMAAGQARAKQIANFAAFFDKDHTVIQDGITGSNTNQIALTPFNPSRKFSLYLTWQANDPLVHYMAGDLLYNPDYPQSVTAKAWTLRQLNSRSTLENIGSKNSRYQPWNLNNGQGNTFVLDPAYVDPGVTASDAWQFPTNKFATIGWLGRVHRGSPWQTIYMKSAPVDPTLWGRWTGSMNPNDAILTQPETDRAIFDGFTTAFNDNASRGQLPINQTNLAAWSALLSGIYVLQADTNENVNNNFSAYPIRPVGSDTNSLLLQVFNGINRERNRIVTNGTAYVHPDATFTRLGDILAVPELTDQSPYLNLAAVQDRARGFNDAVYEWLPQQILSLVRVGEPRFVVYAYGQTLRPAPRSILTGGAFAGMCTNYQIVAEAATRAVIQVKGSADPAQTDSYPPRIVVESYNILPPD